jgi:O-antigen biosynthesis protein
MIEKYKYNIDLNENNASSIILKSIKNGADILEIGTASGSMTQYLKENLNCKVYGIEYNETDANIAKKYLQHLLIKNVEEIDFQSEYQNITFDTIILADVLEHLQNPLNLLKKIKPLLKENGEILISIPNVSYIGVVLNLIDGKFEYNQTGILDETHIKFFTLNSFTNLINQSNLFIESIDRVNINTSKSEFRTDIKKYPNQVIDYIISKNSEAFTYQFIYKLKKNQKLFNENKSPQISNHIFLNSELDITNEYNNLLKKYSDLNIKTIEIVNELRNLEVRYTDLISFNTLLISRLKLVKMIIIILSLCSPILIYLLYLKRDF